MKNIHKIVLTILAIVIVTNTTGCMPVADPNPNPDHGANVVGPANGIQLHPDRPDGIPGDFLNLSWHVVVVNKNSGRYIAGATVKLKITAESPNAVGGNVHGGYPFELKTYVPYTHTIWYQPGVQVNSTLIAVVSPPLDNSEIECTASGSGNEINAADIDPSDQTCVIDIFLR